MVKMSIEKIIREELTMESDELGWIKDVEPLSGGEYYNHTKSICFGDREIYCDVRIDNNHITFYLNEDEFGNFWDENGYWDGDSGIMEPIFIYGTPYDGGGDWYEFDDDEFNYSYYHLNDNQKHRFNEILRDVGGDGGIEDFTESMGSLMEEFKHPIIQNQFDSLISEYLEELGYVIQKNRWLAVSRQWDSVSEKAGVYVSMSRDEIEIQIPIEVAYQKYYSTPNINDLTQLLKAIIKELSYTNWYEWFYEAWSTEDVDKALEHSFNDFLDKAEDYLYSEDFKKWEKVLSNFEEFGIKHGNSYVTNSPQFRRENPNNGTIWIIDLNPGYDKANVRLYKKQRHTYYRNQEPLRGYRGVPIEKIQKYVKPL